MGIEFYAYNQAGINKLADLFAKLGLMEGASGGSGVLLLQLLALWVLQLEQLRD